MMNKDFVQFKKERDLGAILSDAFKFLRLEWKPFFTTVFKISMFPIAAFIVISVIAYFNYSEMYSSLLDINIYTEDQAIDDMGLFFGWALLVAFMYLLAFAMVTGSAMFYIKSYVNNDGLINYEEIKENTQAKFWSLVGLFVLIGIIVTIGTLFCILPGIYFWVVLSLAPCLLVFSEISSLDSIGDAFNFIKGHWWETFGVLFVVALIVGMLGGVSQIPATLYSMVKMLTVIEANDPHVMSGVLRDPIYIGLIMISYLIRFFLYTITLITTVFVFFDIDEQENASGSFEMIDRLGN